MGQQFHTELPKKKISEIEVQKSIDSIQSSNISYENLLLSSEESNRRQLESLKSQSLDSSQHGKQGFEENLQSLERVEKLLQFIGEIIYYCKLYMKKQHQYHYKISALLFYKYFYDKFRQLLARYWALYQKQQISRQYYEKKVALVFQIKDTFIKIKKFIYSKIPFLSEDIRSFLNEETDDLCFKRKQFFTNFLYKEVRQIIGYYNQQTEGQFREYGINCCYIRMMKAIFIIEQLEFCKFIIKPKNNQVFPDYDIDHIENWTEDEMRSKFSETFELFSKVKRS